ncbi:MAG: hypothetical protein V4590_02870 [Bacteroidota bacterium]
MKKNRYTLVLLTTLLSSSLFAQSIGSNNRKFESGNKIWVQNSKQQIIANSGDTISKDFFNTTWAAVQTTSALQKDEHITIIFQPKNAGARAERFGGNRFSEESLKYIRGLNSETVVTVIINNQNSRHGSLQFVLQ